MVGIKMKYALGFLLAMCFTSSPSLADGLTAAQLNALLAAAPNPIASTDLRQIGVAIDGQIGRPGGIAGLDAAGQIFNPAGPATIQQIHNRAAPISARLMDLLGDTINVRSFAAATSTGNVGGVIDTTTISAAASGATTVVIKTTPDLVTKLATARYLGIDGNGAAPISGVNYPSSGTASLTIPPLSLAVAAGTPVSIAQQDDRPAFQAAGAALSSSNGVPGTLEVPADHYMIVRDEVTLPDGASLVEHGGVFAAHGSAMAEATDSCGGCFWGGASGTVYAQAPTSMNANAFAILQNVKAPPGQQVNLLLLSGMLDYDGYAAGSPAAVVGEEVRTSVAPSIARGLQFAYHAVMEWRPGQYGGSSLAELEYLNNSGCDSRGDLLDQGSCSDGQGGTASNARYGLHLDALGNTNDTVGIVFGSWANVGWHIGMACTYSVLDWCIAAHYKYGAHYKLSDIDAGFDMHGRMIAVGGLISGGTTDPGATKGLVVTRDGNTANVPSTAPASDILAPSYGIATSFLRAYLGAFFYGGALFLNGGADTTPTSRQWDASFGNWGVYTNYLYVGHPISNATATFASLPSGCTAGQSVFVLDARNHGEAAGKGTGSLAYCTTAGVWYANGDPVAN